MKKPPAEEPQDDSSEETPLERLIDLTKRVVNVPKDEAVEPKQKPEEKH